LTRVLPPRVRAVVKKPALWVSLVYLCGVGLRLIYTFAIQSPIQTIYADMGLYVGLARRIAAQLPLTAPDVAVPLGYPGLLSFLIKGDHSLQRVVILQLVLSCLVPLVVGLLGAAAYGRRTGLLAVVFASLYFPFIEYGALFLTEIHFIFWMTLGFAGWFAARRVRRRAAALGLTAAGGLCMSIAATFKSVALIAAFMYFVVDGVALLVARQSEGPRRPWFARFARLKPWLLRGAVVAVAAAPLLIGLARICTRANDGRFCVTGNKMGADFLMGHYGRIADVEWKSEGHDLFRFGSPGALLRHHDAHVKVSFSMTDSAANIAEAWRWISAHPGEAIVLSIDHVYDTLFGSSMWPTFNHAQWPLANLSQYVFIVFLFIPTVLACASVMRRGLRATLTSRTALVLSPVWAIIITVMIATGEVRYRIPFDVFFIAVACAWAARDLSRVDGSSLSPSETGASPPRS
jgi:hypothetical protein